MAEYNREIHYVVADSYDLCVEKIKTLCGTNYQIIRKKTIKTKGILGFGKKDAVQMAYIVLPENNLTRYQQYPVSNLDFAKEKEKILTERKLPNPQMEELLSEVKALRRDFSNIQPYSQEDEHESVLKIRQLMEDNEFSQSYIKKILDKLKKELTIDDLEDFDLVQKQVVDWIGETIKIADIKLKTRPQVIVLVGPTGVGKTTTVAKIAARYNPIASDHPLRVCLLNADNYRIGAKDQIETYASLLSIPIASIDKDGDFVNKVNSYGTDTDVIIVDTLGCSHKDYEKIAVLRRRLDSKGAMPEVYLTMTAMTKASDMKEILQQFEIFSYNSVIVTKLDETGCIGNLISVLDEKNKSIAYLTTGQSVPSDIEEASVVKMLLMLSGFKIDREHIEEKFSK